VYTYALLKQLLTTTLNYSTCNNEHGLLNIQQVILEARLSTQPTAMVLITNIQQVVKVIWQKAASPLHINCLQP